VVYELGLFLFQEYNPTQLEFPPLFGWVLFSWSILCFSLRPLSFPPPFFRDLRFLDNPAYTSTFPHFLFHFLLGFLELVSKEDPLPNARKEAPPATKTYHDLIEHLLNISIKLVYSGDPNALISSTERAQNKVNQAFRSPNPPRKIRTLKLFYPPAFKAWLTLAQLFPPPPPQTIVLYPFFYEPS